MFLKLCYGELMVIKHFEMNKIKVTTQYYTVFIMANVLTVIP